MLLPLRGTQSRQQGPEKGQKRLARLPVHAQPLLPVVFGDLGGCIASSGRPELATSSVLAQELLPESLSRKHVSFTALECPKSSYDACLQDDLHHFFLQ